MTTAGAFEVTTLTQALGFILGFINFILFYYWLLQQHDFFTFTCV